MMKHFKIPALALIEFLDHSKCTGEMASPISCEVIGMVHKEDKDAYYVASWVSDKVIDVNTEQFCILKSTVKRVTLLSRRRK